MILHNASMEHDNTKGEKKMSRHFQLVMNKH